MFRRFTSTRCLRPLEPMARAGRGGLGLYTFLVLTSRPVWAVPFFLWNTFMTLMVSVLISCTMTRHRQMWITPAIITRLSDGLLFRVVRIQQKHLFWTADSSAFSDILNFQYSWHCFACRYLLLPMFERSLELSTLCCQKGLFCCLGLLHSWSLTLISPPDQRNPCQAHHSLPVSFQ